MRSTSGWRGLRKSARALPSATLVVSMADRVPVPDRSANTTGWLGTPFSKASTTRAVMAACLLPPTQGGLELRRTNAGWPGVIVIGPVTPGAFPASSRTTITIGSAKV